MLLSWSLPMFFADIYCVYAFTKCECTLRKEAKCLFEVKVSVLIESLVLNMWFRGYGLDLLEGVFHTDWMVSESNVLRRDKRSFA